MTDLVNPRIYIQGFAFEFRWVRVAERWRASRGSFASHWHHDKSVVAPAEVAADGGEIVAFEIEEAPGDVEGVRWIQEQAEAGNTVRLRFF